MKNLWRRTLGNARKGLKRRDEGPRSGSTYAREFIEAFARTDALGLSSTPVRLLVEKDCVDLEAVTPLVHRYLDEFGGDEAVGQAFAICVNIIPYLYAETGIPFTLTLGWFEQMGRELYRHDEQLLKTMLRGGIAAWQEEGIPLHVWLTSPACEVVDVTLPTTIAAVSGADELAGGIIYISNRDPHPPVIYHPTMVGIEFLEKIGAAIELGGARH